MSKFLHKLDSELQLIYKNYLNLQKLGKKRMDWLHPCLLEGDKVPVIVISTANQVELEKYQFNVDKLEEKGTFSGTLQLGKIEEFVSLKQVLFIKFAGEPADIPISIKIDPRLKVIMNKPNKYATKKETGKSGGVESLGVLLKFRGSYEFLTVLGCQVISVVGNIAAVRIPIDKIVSVANHPNVIRIETNRSYSPDLDETVEHINAHNLRNDSPPFSGTGKFTGKGVIVGIIDSGFQYSHGVFRDPADSSKSRVLFLYDQSLDQEPGDNIPIDMIGNPLPKGVIYTKEQLESAMAAEDPLTVVRHRPKGHGTRVAGIAVGNGAQAGNCHGSYHYVGVAPEADIILVRLITGSTGQLGTSDNLVEAITFLMRKAEEADKPLVINISQGDNLGAHDGSSLVEEMIDLFLLLGINESSKGFTIVKSAGNLGNKKRHAETNVPANNAGAPVELKINVVPPKNSDDQRDIEIDIWYDGASDLDIEIVPPGGNITGTNTASPGDNVSFTEDTKNSTITIDSQTLQTNGKKRIFIDIDANNPDHSLSGVWTMKLTNTTATATDIHAYIERDQLATFSTFFTKSGTISIPGTAELIITVGNHTTKGKSSGGLYTSSGRGPTSDNRIKPEISAPGTNVYSARHDPDAGSCCDCCYDFYIAKTGTSYSAPHVSGAAALLLEKNPELDNDEIRQALMDTAVTDSFTAAVPNNKFGAGKLDVQAAVDSVAVGITMNSSFFERERFQTFNLNPEPLFAKNSPISRLTETPKGKELYGLLLGNYREIRDLVNTNKRMATIWHRNRGPLLVHHLNRASLLPSVAVPTKIEGTPLIQYLTNIVSGLKNYVSPKTCEALNKAMEEVPHLIGNTFNQFVSRYEEMILESDKMNAHV